MESSQQKRGVTFPELPRLPTIVSFRPALNQLNKQRKETAALRQQWRLWSDERILRCTPSTSDSRKRHNPTVKNEPTTAAVAGNEPAAKSSSALVASAVQQTTKVIEVTATSPAVKMSKNDNTGTSTTENARETNAVPTLKSTSKAGEVVSNKPEAIKRPFQSLPSSFDFNSLLQPPYRSATTKPAAANDAKATSNPPDVNSNEVTSDAKRAKILALLASQNATDRMTSAHNDVTATSPLPRRATFSRRGRRGVFDYHDFRALTQGHSLLPKLMEVEEPERPGVARSMTAIPSPRRDIREWQNEVVKVVPNRPHFSTPLPNEVNNDKVMNFRYPYKVVNYDPSCHFYRSWSKCTDKDFVISPEWASEKHSIRPSLGPKAKTDINALLQKDLTWASM